MVRAATVAAVVALSACVTGRSAAPAAAAKGQTAEKSAPTDAVATTTVICRTERPIGSNIAKRVCYREQDLEAARSRTQNDLIKMMQQASAQPQRD